jgi:hypothetical protein
MSQSNINGYIRELSKRHDEISLLINHAENLFEQTDENSQKLYDSICRSISILLVTHLEGFIKDFTKELILDINQFINFRDVNKSVKRQYISSFLISNDNKKLFNQKSEKLILKFEEIDNKDDDEKYIKITHDPFLFKDNKNPKANVIEYVCKNFGIKNIFSHLKESSLEIVFENDRIETNDLIENIYSELIEKTEEFPFNINASDYNLSTVSIARNEKTYWETFLEELLNTRHKIVHGSTLDNIKSHTELKDFEQKTILIQYGIIILLIDSNFNSQ